MEKLYLLGLKTAHFSRHPTSRTPLKMGNANFIGNDNKKKFLWKLSVIQKAIPGTDHIIRFYEVKTANNILKISFQNLYILKMVNIHETFILFLVLEHYFFFFTYFKFFS